MCMEDCSGIGEPDASKRRIFMARRISFTDAALEDVMVASEVADPEPLNMLRHEQHKTDPMWYILFTCLNITVTELLIDLLVGACVGGGSVGSFGR